MSLPFFSPAHSQAKKRAKGVSLTSRSVPSSSCQEVLIASLCCLWIFQVEHREKSIGDNIPLHGLGEKNSQQQQKSRKFWHCLVIFFWVLKQLLVLHYQRVIIMAKQLNKMEIHYLFIFCVLGEQMQSEKKFKREMHSKKPNRKCIENMSQAFLKYLYLRFQMSQISLFTNYLLGGIDFNCMMEKKTENMLRQKNW